MKIKVIIASILFWIVCFFAWYIFVYSTKVKGIYHFTESSEKYVSLVKDDGTVYISDGISFKWDIVMDKWTVVIWRRVKYSGTISLNEWKIIIWDFTVLKGNIETEMATVSLWKKVKVIWKISKEAKMSLYSDTLITWTKPSFYKTLDRPDALVYFDTLPEEHKNKFGHIFLIKNNVFDGIDVRNITPENYYEWIYYYENGELKEVDLKAKWNDFLKVSKGFLNSIPAHRRGVYSVWWATRKRAYNKSKYWDIYLPSKGSSYVFIHEMWHIIDFKWAFSDNHIPKYPFSSKQNAITAYGWTHPWEDFAESYKYYIASPTSYKSLFEKNPEAKKKYEYMKKYVFKWKEY